MGKCDLCKSEDATRYCVGIPLPITKSQEMRGVMPSGDNLLRVCKECNPSTIFTDPETGKVVKWNRVI